MDHRKIAWDGMNWIHLVEDRDPVVGSCEYSNEHLGSITFWELLQ
jgi:hypothetical protein